MGSQFLRLMYNRNLLLPRLALQLASRRPIQTSSIVQSGHEIEHWWGPERNNGREVVGFGHNGDEIYWDRLDYWYPAIRFRKDDDKIVAIREKEKGDWKNLSLEDKKTLYRYSFKQTLAEFEAPTGYWKVILSGAFFISSFVFGYAAFLKKCVFSPMPPTFQPEYKETEIERALVLGKGQFLGAPARFDYEKNQWKN